MGYLLSLRPELFHQPLQIGELRIGELFRPGEIDHSNLVYVCR
jgi:hypothetical protein